MASKEKPRLPGDRVEVLGSSVHLTPDGSLGDVAVTVPDIKNNENWRQAAGSPQGLTGNLQLSSLKHDDKATIGDGNSWEQALHSAPIIASGLVYAMDSRGYISAHDAGKIHKVRWLSKAAVSKGELDLLGGGLAYDSARLFVTTGRGDLFALDATNGKLIWKQSIGVPLRAAPKAGDGRVYAVSVDNQLFAFDAEKGKQLWNHRGINENAGFLALISPAVSEALVIAPYSSGEIHALDSATGQDVWNDTLLKPHHNSAAGAFSGVGGNPVIKDDILYAVGSNGVSAAFTLANGRRIWEQDISSLNSPWISGDFLYILSSDDELVCLLRADGRIKWIKPLQRFEDEKRHRHPYFWSGPVMAEGHLLIAGAHGQMLVIEPKDGSIIQTSDIPEDSQNAPIIAGSRLYMLTKNAKLHVLY